MTREDRAYEKQTTGPDLARAEDAVTQREFLHFRIDAYLGKSGWSRTSNTPGSFWLWEKKLDDGRTVLVSQDMAIAMQQYFEDLEYCRKKEGRRP